MLVSVSSMVLSDKSIGSQDCEEITGLACPPSLEVSSHFFSPLLSCFLPLSYSSVTLNSLQTSREGQNLSNLNFAFGDSPVCWNFTVSLELINKLRSNFQSWITPSRLCQSTFVQTDQIRFSFLTGALSFSKHIIQVSSYKSMAIIT